MQMPSPLDAHCIGTEADTAYSGASVVIIGNAGDLVAGSEERKPNAAKDQYRKPGIDDQKHERRRAGFGLACFCQRV
jgi:hypothetical protein